MTLRLRDLVEGSGEALQLECLTGALCLDRFLPDSEVASPGLALAGFTSRFIANRIHVFGETEITYLASLDSAGRQAALEALFGFELPVGFRLNRSRSGAIDTPASCSVTLPCGTASTTW